MNLAEATWEYLFPNKFHVWQHVGARLWKPDQAAIAEMILTRLGQAYIANGGGLSHYLAGQSVGSAGHIVADRWSKFAKVVARRTCYMQVAHMETEILRAKAASRRELKERYDRRKEQIRELDKQLADAEEADKYRHSVIQYVVQQTLIDVFNDILSSANQESTSQPEESTSRP